MNNFLKVLTICNIVAIAGETNAQNYNNYQQISSNDLAYQYDAYYNPNYYYPQPQRMENQEVNNNIQPYFNTDQQPANNNYTSNNKPKNDFPVYNYY